MKTALLLALASTALAAPQLKKRATFQYFGVNQAGAEFGETTLPGEWGTHYIFPDPSSISTLIADGFNTFRIQFKMERLTPELTGGFDEAYLANLTETVNYVTNAGAYAVLDPHNYGRFNNEIISSPSDFQTWWTNVAGQFVDNPKVVFDTNNEYHTMDQTLVLNLNQAAITGIRSTGATQPIFIEGNSWSGAWTWVTVNDNLKALTDPLDNLVYEMHQYLDTDGSGTSESCVSGTIGAERVAEATQWLKDNGKVGILGEFAGGNNEVCKEAVGGLLEALQADSEVWLGALWWAAGPWWGNYMYSMEPPNGIAYGAYLGILQGFMG